MPEEKRSPFEIVGEKNIKRDLLNFMKNHPNCFQEPELVVRGTKLYTQESLQKRLNNISPQALRNILDFEERVFDLEYVSPLFEDLVSEGILEKKLDSEKGWVYRIRNNSELVAEATPN